MIGFYFAPFDGHGGLLNWMFGGGIGTNLGATIIVVAAGVWKVRKMWRTHRAHQAKMLTHARHQTALLEEIHHKTTTGEDHPRVTTRLARGLPSTPSIQP